MTKILGSYIAELKRLYESQLCYFSHMTFLSFNMLVCFFFSNMQKICISLY
jgi:hypothetical protein